MEYTKQGKIDVLTPKGYFHCLNETPLFVFAKKVCFILSFKRQHITLVILTFFKKIIVLHCDNLNLLAK